MIAMKSKHPIAILILGVAVLFLTSFYSCESLPVYDIRVEAEGDFTSEREKDEKESEN